MGAHKKTSKRQPLRLKGTIAKKARASLKREQKRVQWTSKKGKLVAVVKSLPDRDQFEADLKDAMDVVESARRSVAKSDKTTDYVVSRCDVIMEVVDGRAAADFHDPAVTIACHQAGKTFLQVVTK